MKFFERVYEVVKKIPKGKVMTYGQVAKLLGTRDLPAGRQVPGRVTPRVIGWALHANKDPKVPCHRVVFADGSLAPGFAFGGRDEQKKRLVKEGITLVDYKVEMGYNQVHL